MPHIPSALITHFWLLCGAWVGGLGALRFHLDLGKQVRAGHVTEAERRRFVRGWALAIVLPCVTWWLLQLSTGPASSPQYMFWPPPQKWLAVAVQLLFWLWLLAWLWLSDGARFLSRMLMVGHPSRPVLLFSAHGIKTMALLAMVGGAAVMFEAHRPG